MQYTLFVALCLERHIVAVKHTQLHKAKKMETTLMIAVGIVSTVAASLALYLLQAHRSTPISEKEADMLWKLHKQNDRCNSHKWHLSKGEKGEILGFECQCGYQYSQKRPLVYQAPSAATGLSSN